MTRQAERPAEQDTRLRWRRLGIVSGLAAIGCCIYPVVLALLGIASAAEAVALGNDLYGTWGWAFRLGGAAIAIAGIVIQVRRRHACNVRTSSKTALGFVAKVAAVTVGVYVVVYWLTTVLGNAST